MRSVHLERDFSDPGALRGYVVTPQVSVDFERILAGLTPGSTQRAWRITGDYGTGKSSFALALARAVAGQHEQLPAEYRKNRIVRTFQSSDRALLPVLVTGTRAPLAVSLVQSLQRALELWEQRGGRAAWRKRIATVAANPDKVDDSIALKLLEETGERLRSGRQAAGLLVILDELGKFLEFAALHPDRQDIYLLQRLAETAARSGNRPLSVVGLLHQGFQAYAEQVSESGQREWEKVAGRFEEVLFQQPLEQAATLVASALNLRSDRLHPSIARLARSAMDATLELGWYGPLASKKFLLELAPQLYPLHPSVLPVAAKLFSRFGQNERSLFSFLASAEPFGLQDYARQPAGDGVFYRLHNLYDYVRASMGHRLSAQSYRSHWNQIDSVIESFPAQDRISTQILKTVALLNLVNEHSMVPTQAAVDLALASTRDIPHDAINRTLNTLQKGKRVLYFRGSASGYCLWPYTSVNLEKAYSDASKAVDVPTRIAPLLQAHIETTAIVARRHYIETGNLRYFEVRYLPVGQLDAAVEQRSANVDGCIFVALCETADERATALGFGGSNPLKSRKDVLLAVPQPLAALRGLFIEAMRWEWIERNVPELAADSYAQEEVSRQLTAAQRVLKERIQEFIGFARTAASTSITWLNQGQAKNLPTNRDLNRFVSDLCDKIYPQAPCVHNELLNRRELSSAAAAARMRLIERLLEHSTIPFLGLDATKKPPEMSMYLSVLARGHIHRESDGGWSIAEPPASRDPLHLRPAFQRLMQTLRAEPDRRVPLPSILKELRAPPFGVRDGVLPLLVAIFAVIYEQDLAFYENGAFLRHLTGPDFQRIIKAPEAFEVQYCRISGVRTSVLEKLARLLGSHSPDAHATNLVEVVRSLCIFAAQLPSYTHKTRKLSPTAASVRSALLTAKEPSALLFRDLPKACNLQPFASEGEASPEHIYAFVETLKAALDELRMIYPSMLEQLKSHVSSAFEHLSLFPQSRDVAASAAERLAAAIKEPRLKAFCLRLADRGLADSEWIEALGSFVCSKVPSHWGDHDLEQFATEFHRLAEQFRRVEAAAFSPSIDGEGSALRVAVTLNDGRDLAQVVHIAPHEEAELVSLEAEFAKLIDRSSRIGVAAASRAIWRHLSAKSQSGQA
jgi:hypothetical protein